MRGSKMNFSALKPHFYHRISSRYTWSKNQKGGYFLTKCAPVRPIFTGKDPTRVLGRFIKFRVIFLVFKEYSKIAYKDILWSACFYEDHLDPYTWYYIFCYYFRFIPWRLTPTENFIEAFSWDIEFGLNF